MSVHVRLGWWSSCPQFYCAFSSFQGRDDSPTSVLQVVSSSYSTSYWVPCLW